MATEGKEKDMVAEGKEKDMVAEEKDTESTPVQEETQSEPKQQTPVNLDAFPEFRKYKSSRDKADAEYKREAEKMRGQMQELQEEMLELVDDPVKRSEMQTNRLQAELKHFQQLAHLSDQRKAISERWEVPEEALEGTDNPSVMTAKAMDYLQTQVSLAQTQLSEAQKVKQVQEVEDDGGHKVSTAPGTPPKAKDVNLTKLTSEIANLRTIAQSGGNKGKQARLSILKLEAEKQQTRRRQAKV